MSLCFGKKKSPEESYKLWEENIKKQKNLMICIYENLFIFCNSFWISIRWKKDKNFEVEKINTLL